MQTYISLLLVKHEVLELKNFFNLTKTQQKSLKIRPGVAEYLEKSLRWLIWFNVTFLKNPLALP